MSYGYLKTVYIIIQNVSSRTRVIFFMITLHYYVT